MEGVYINGAPQGITFHETDKKSFIGHQYKKTSAVVYARGIYIHRVKCLYYKKKEY